MTKMFIIVILYTLYKQINKNRVFMSYQRFGVFSMRVSTLDTITVSCIYPAFLSAFPVLGFRRLRLCKWVTLFHTTQFEFTCLTGLEQCLLYTCTWLACSSGVLWDVRFGTSQLCCLGSSAGRALCLEYRVSWVRVPPEAAHFSRKSDCLGCAVLLCLVCLTLLSSFFLPSHLSLKHVYTCTCTQRSQLSCLGRALAYKAGGRRSEFSFRQLHRVCFSVLSVLSLFCDIHAWHVSYANGLERERPGLLWGWWPT